MDVLLGKIESTLKGYCNESELHAGFMCGDPDVNSKYHTISSELVARLSEFKSRVESVLYDKVSKECRARDGSGTFVNFPHGNSLCVGTFSKYNIPQYAAEKSKEYPGENPLVAAGRLDFAILRKNIDAHDAKEAAESQKRLEDSAVWAYEAEQRHQDKCWDQLEQRGYGDANCYY